MSGHYIRADEFLFLTVWLSSPALLLTWLVSAVVFARRGVFRAGHVVRALIGLTAATIAILVFSVALRLLVPWLQPPRDVLLPDRGIVGLVPPVFVPAFVAAGCVAPLMAWWVTKGLARRCS